jgi:hypothetical protein
MNFSVHQIIPKIGIKDFTVHLVRPILGSSTEEIEIDGSCLEVSLLN